MPGRAIDYKVLFEKLATPHVLLDPDFDIVEMNGAYLQATNRTRQDLLGKNMFSAFPASGESYRMLRDSLARVRDDGVEDVLALIPYPIPNDDGFEMRYWSATHVPVRGEDGALAFILQNTQDVTELHRLRSAIDVPSVSNADVLGVEMLRRAEAVQATNETLLAEQSHLRRLFMEAPGFMCVLRCPDMRFELANDAYENLVGGRMVVGKTVREALPELEGQGFYELLERVALTREPFIGRAVRAVIQHVEARMPEERFLDFIYQPILDTDGTTAAIFVQGSDVTDQVRANERQRLLIDELNHRVKNVLATVQAIAVQTLRRGRTPEEFAQTFQARLFALSRTHDALVESQWDGALLNDLLGQELSPFGESRVTIRGKNPFLPARLSLLLGMVLHELAGNAAKHGALSVPDGRLRVDADVAQGKDGETRLVLEWLEEGGPRVAARRSSGFGSRLIERSIRTQAKGDLTMDYRPQGLYCRIDVPLAEAE